MKKLFFQRALILAATVLVFAACKKEKPSSPDNNGNGNGNGTGNDGTLIEVIDVGNGNIATIKAIATSRLPNEHEEGYISWNYTILATCSYQNGGFKLTLPNTFPENCLKTVREEFEPDFTLDNVNMSDPEAKIGLLKGRVLEAYSSAEKRDIGYFYLSGYNGEIGFVGYYVYADRDFTLKGDYTDGYYYYDQSGNEAIKYFDVSFDCSFKKGWNIVYDGGDNDENLFVTTQKPSGVNTEWLYEPNNAPAIRFKKESADTKCTWMAFKHYDESGLFDIYPDHYFGTSTVTTDYIDFVGYLDYAYDLVYSNTLCNNYYKYDGDWLDLWMNNTTSSITGYRFEENKAYTIVCGDDGNGNPVFKIEKEQKSLSSSSNKNIRDKLMSVKSRVKR